MIGYYIHHVGLGHLHRALSIVKHLPYPVTAISSLPAHPDWPGPWLRLARDDLGGPSPIDPTAGGVLHWAPRHDQGLQRRMAQLTEWIAQYRPSVLVVDLSVEVVVQARLLGVPVVTMALPGSRPDRAHQLGYQLADAILAPWPAELRSIGPDLQAHLDKVTFTGAISRYADRTGGDRVPADPGGPNRVVILGGSGPAGVPATLTVPAWTTTTLGGDSWADDPWALIEQADVVVTHAGLGALADVATTGRPAIVLPQPRPHDEQRHTARGLSAHGVATVAFRIPTQSDWAELLAEARSRGGDGWQRWLAGVGAAGAAEVIRTVADTARAASCR